MNQILLLVMRKLQIFNDKLFCCLIGFEIFDFIVEFINQPFGIRESLLSVRTAFLRRCRACIYSGNLTLPMSSSKLRSPVGKTPHKEWREVTQVPRIWAPHEFLLNGSTAMPCMYIYWKISNADVVVQVEVS